MTNSAARAVRHTSTHTTAGESAGRSSKRGHVQRAPSELAMRSTGAPRLMLLSEFSVNKPNDRFEQQANKVADSVMRAPAEPVEDRTPQVAAAQTVAVQRVDLDPRAEDVEEAQNPRKNLMRAAIDPRAEVVEEAQDPRNLMRLPAYDRRLMRVGERAPPAVGAATARTIKNPGAGQPLPRAVRNRIEPQLGADLSHVRVHQSAPAQQAASSLQARAFTNGANIFLNRSESPNNTWLMAHEATHVVQQGAATVQRAPSGESQALQRSADSDPPSIQRGILDSLASGVGAAWDATGGRLVDAAGEVIAMGADFFWTVLEQVAPSFVPILRQIQQEGILGFMGGLIRDAFGRLFVGLGGDPGTLEAIFGTFDSLVGTVQTILAALAAGDCGPLFEALGQLRDAVSQMVGDAWNAVTDFFRPVGEFFSGLWQQFGAPLVDWISQAAGDVWQRIQDFGAQIWAWTQPVRDTLAAAWNWVKEQIFGTDNSATGESEGGLVNWIMGKATEVWDAIKAELDPVIAPIQGFAQSVIDFLPLGAIMNLRDTVTGWMGDVQNVTASMQEPQGAVTNQASLRDEILPAILASIGRVQEGIAGAGGWISDVIGGIVERVGGMVDTIAGIPILSPLAGAVGWVRDGINRLAGMVQSGVIVVFNTVADGLGHLVNFLRPILSALIELVTVISDLAGALPNFIAGIWNRIPACIREPIENFIKDNILAQIPIFAQLMQIPDLWGRLTGMVTTILRQVFVDGNLLGAAWTFFSNLLSFLGIPPELVLNILNKAATAISDILSDPVGFFMNLLRAIREGFSRFFGNILTHLLGGVANWLFGEMQEAGLRPPPDLSLRSIINFVLEVLGISLENVFQRMERHPRIGPERTRRIRAVYNTITGALSWIVRLINEGPGAIWEEIQSQLSNLWNTVLQGVIAWINRTVVERATVRLLSMLDPSGIMAVVNSILAIWNAIQSFVRYMREMLEVVNTVLDGITGIARGAFDLAAGFLEQGLARILPIAIGFLANQVGLSGLGRRIAEMIGSVREMVNSAIDWLLNGAISLIDSVMAGGRAVAGAVAGWWGARREFRDSTGEAHSLYFNEAGAGQYQLMVASNPQNAITFLEGLTPATPEATAQRNEALQIARRTRTQETGSDAVNADLARLGELVGALFPAGGQRDGSQANPFEIYWHKDMAAPQPIRLRRTIGGPLESISPYARTPVTIDSNLYSWGENRDRARITRIQDQNQSLAGGTPGDTRADAAGRQAAGRDQRDSFASGGSSVGFGTRAAGGASVETTTVTIGVSPQYQVTNGSIVGPSIFSSTFRNDNVLNSFWSILEAAGFVADGYSLDHITDLMFGGRDVYENLWPVLINPTGQQSIDLHHGVDVRLLRERGITSQPGDVRGVTETKFPRNCYFIIRGYRPNNAT